MVKTNAIRISWFFFFYFRKAMLERKRFLCGFRLLRIRHVV